MTGGNTAKILLLKEIAVGVRAFLTVTGNAAFAVPDVHPSAAAAATSTVSQVVSAAHVAFSVGTTA